MELYKNDNVWESGDPALIGVFIENTGQDLLDKLKDMMSDAGIDRGTIHTILFTRLEFGIIFVEEGTFKPEYSMDPPEDITLIEDKVMKLLVEELANYHWDALWYTEFFSTLDEDLNGLANHMVGITDNDVDFCYVSTKDKPDEPILFFRNCISSEAETTNT